MSTATKILLLLGVTLVAAQDTSTEAPSDGLTQTDYIIIGVTAGVGAIVVIGGIVFACMNSRKTKKEKDAIYHDYLNKKIDFQTQGQDNLAYASSTQQLAIHPESGYKAPVNPVQYYNNQPIPYPPGVRTGYSPALPSGYAQQQQQPYEQTPADVYVLPPKQPAPAQPYAQPAPVQSYAQPVPVQQPAPIAQPAPAPQPAPTQPVVQQAPVQQAPEPTYVAPQPIYSQTSPDYTPRGQDYASNTNSDYSFTPEPQPAAAASGTSSSNAFDDDYRTPDGYERRSQDSESVEEGMTAF